MKSNHASTQPVNNYSTYIKLSLVAIIWGGTFVAGRYISVETPPLLSASLRFILAGMTLIVFLVLSGKMFVKINLSQLLKIIGLGLCGIYAYNLFFFYSLHHTTASRELRLSWR
ncbi:DMT family transporter [Photorhabdus sp. APURE]|uniref:DMT family transporter n=1 Tax=Photorhabdus aballayi TaxID=2991723 RepID=UPI00223E2AC6|nr:DMT family transporter [Photorhabdus aballayi]MCW7547274.1 DMT family transporter [Photorhabdus aballayi]